MKRTSIQCLFAVVFALTLGSCEKNGLELYGDEAYLVFEMPTWGLQNTPLDSMVCSFPALGDECTEHVMNFKMRIIGKAVDYNRAIKLRVNAEKSTAQEGVNFKLDPIVMPAGQYTVDVPLTIYRAGLKDKQVRLQLEVDPNEHFGVGFEKTSVGIFLWGDKYIKPSNWDTSNYKNCFGEFTETRYAFILQSCGILELPDPQDIFTLGFYNSKVREALYEYNKTHDTPLEDELGPVSFWAWSGGGGVG
ncbi:MAG: DUF4843 domain-containing protein [Prevotella sp.]